MARPTHVIGNWKQHLLTEPAQALAQACVHAATHAPVEVAIAPTLVALPRCAPHCHPHSQLGLLAQDCAAQEQGAFTGEVGPAMLADVGALGAIVGHSERRSLLGEGDALVAAKTCALLSAGLRAVVCVGEPLDVREQGDHGRVVEAQLRASLNGALSVARDVRWQLVVAYEPVWAIGTGKTASPHDAQAMHAHLRSVLTNLAPELGGCALIYGGSVKPENAAALWEQPDIDGFLVGGASLDPAAFLAIVQACAA